MSISLNSVSKYKARVLPSVIGYQKVKGTVPAKLSFGLAALIAFYRGKNGSQVIALKDEDYILALFNTLWSDFEAGKTGVDQIVISFLKDKMIWGEDLTMIPGFASVVSSYLNDIVKNGMPKALENILNAKRLQK
jgi:tagaturonate reductase